MLLARNNIKIDFLNPIVFLLLVSMNVTIEDQRASEAIEDDI